jgi:hypothetical protein
MDREDIIYGKLVDGVALDVEPDDVGHTADELTFEDAAVFELEYMGLHSEGNDDHHNRQND